MRLVRKNLRQRHIGACARHLVAHDLAWFTEGNAYLQGYWQKQRMDKLFDTYQEFLEEVGHAMNEILVAKEESLPPLRLVVDNTRARQRR